jgi:hypothetical protein
LYELFVEAPAGVLKELFDHAVVWAVAAAYVAVVVAALTVVLWPLGLARYSLLPGLLLGIFSVSAFFAKYQQPVERTPFRNDPLDPEVHEEEVKP